MHITIPSPAGGYVSDEPRKLSIEEIEAVARGFKEDLDRKQEQFLLRDENRDAYAAMMGKRYVGQFIEALKLAAGSHLREYLSKPARARAINIRPDLQSNRK